MQKCVNLVDFVKSFQTSIHLQNSASIQPRTSLSKFEGDLKKSFFIACGKLSCRVPPLRFGGGWRGCVCWFVVGGRGVIGEAERAASVKIKWKIKCS